MAVSDADIAKDLQEILQSDEFAQGLNDRFLQILRELMAKVMAWADGLGFWTRMTILGVCLLLLAAIFAQVVYSILRSNLPSHRTMASGGHRGDVQVTSAMLLERARELADLGHVRDAARALQQAVLVHMCHARDIPWRASLADWEWVDILKPSARTIAFIQSAQRLSFGPEPVRAGYDRCAQEALALLQEATHVRDEAAS